MYKGLCYRSPPPLAPTLISLCHRQVPPAPAKKTPMEHPSQKQKALQQRVKETQTAEAVNVLKSVTSLAPAGDESEINMAKDIFRGCS